MPDSILGEINNCFIDVLTPDAYFKNPPSWEYLLNILGNDGTYDGIIRIIYIAIVNLSKHWRVLMKMV